MDLRWRPQVAACVLLQLAFIALCLTRSRWYDQAPSVATVQLPCGPLYGLVSSDVAAFRGLPYGVAPLGRRRWRPAEAAACTAGWAVKDGASCIQGGATDSEDCLTLNVFVPSRSLGSKAAALPVIVWIYGGSNVMGDVAFYGPIENIVRKRDCVLVAMNYRVGIFGYLALAELAKVDVRNTSGNLGIADQQLAMRWVQRNIEAFGGDPGKVTIMGQSSGGTNVFAHLASESSRGLFHRAISLSGSPNITMDRRSKEEQDRRLILPRTPCATLSNDDLLECLYALDAQTLHQALPESYKLFDSLYDYPTDHLGLGARVSGLLCVDGVTISAPLEEALARPVNDVPVLFQSMQAEMACAPAPHLANISAQQFRVFLEEQFVPHYGAQVAQQIHDMYKRYTPPEYGAYAVDADSATACGLRSLAEAAGRGFRSPVYWGTVTASPSHPLDGQQFAFHNWDFKAASGTYGTYQPSHQDLHLGHRLLRDWFDLVLDGELRGGWRRVQPGQVFGSVVGEHGTTWHEDHKAEVCDFWDSIGVDRRWWWMN